MAYYDIYDSNDNLIASDVWIDDGSDYSGEPVRLHKRKLLYSFTAFAGIVLLTGGTLPMLNGVIKKGDSPLVLIPTLAMGVILLTISMIMLLAIKKVEGMVGGWNISYKNEITVEALLKCETDDNIFKAVIKRLCSKKSDTDKVHIDHITTAYLAVRMRRLVAWSDIPLIVLPHVATVIAIVAENIGQGTLHGNLVYLSTVSALILLLINAFKTFQRYRLEYEMSLPWAAGILALVFFLSFIVAYILMVIIPFSALFTFSDSQLIFALGIVTLAFNGDVIVRKIKK